MILNDESACDKVGQHVIRELLSLRSCNNNNSMNGNNSKKSNLPLRNELAVILFCLIILVTDAAILIYSSR